MVNQKLTRREFVAGSLAASLRDESQAQEDTTGGVKYGLFWGDLHNHNAVGYAKGSLERSYDIARDHLGYPGAYGEGLVAAYAKTLTRESIMEALKARRTYGVSGDRIELDFRINDHWMGRTIPATEARSIHVKVKGKDVIDRVEVLRNNEVIHRVCRPMKKGQLMP